MPDTLTASSPIADLKLGKRITEALTKAKYDTVGKLTAKTRDGIADLRTIGAPDADRIAAALAAHGLTFADPRGTMNICTTCPTCPECGGRRATSARNVVTDVTGRPRHGGWHERRPQQPCLPCDQHHANLVTNAAALIGA
jgi:hypothetical protein